MTSCILRPAVFSWPARPTESLSVDGQVVVAMLRVEGLHPKRLVVNGPKNAVLAVAVGSGVVRRVNALALLNAWAGHNDQAAAGEEVRGRRRRLRRAGRVRRSGRRRRAAGRAWRHGCRRWWRRRPWWERHVIIGEAGARVAGYGARGAHRPGRTGERTSPAVATRAGGEARYVPVMRRCVACRRSRNVAVASEGT
eukprot:scaffold8351_cov54-Phaeocystis_antarctica.AAC.2